MSYELKGCTVEVIGKLSMSESFRNYNMSHTCTDAVELQYVLPQQVASCHYMPRTF